MPNPHVSLAIAQTVFYVPIVPLAIYVLVRHWPKRPRMAWSALILFSLMRLAGGPVVIALDYNQDNLGLAIAAIVLLNVGVVPLIISSLGLIRIAIWDNFRNVDRYRKWIILVRLAVVPAIGLLTAGGALDGSASTMNLAKILALLGYAIFAAMLAVLIAIETHFLVMKKSSLIPTSQRVLLGALMASPFLIIRTVYGILEVASEYKAGSMWNAVEGSTIAFALMALLPEYIALCIIFWVALSVGPDRGVPAIADDVERGGKLSSVQ